MTKKGLKKRGKRKSRQEGFFLPMTSPFFDLPMGSPRCGRGGRNFGWIARRQISRSEIFTGCPDDVIHRALERSPTGD
jgi:hypothetical protein